MLFAIFDQFFNNSLFICLTFENINSEEKYVYFEDIHLADVQLLGRLVVG
jgi:hypothetical protein